MDVNIVGEIEDRNIPLLHPINLYVAVSTRLACRLSITEKKKKYRKITIWKDGVNIYC